MSGSIDNIRFNGSIALPVADGSFESSILSIEYENTQVYFDFYSDEALENKVTPTGGMITTYGSPTLDGYRPAGLHPIVLASNNAAPRMSGSVRQVKVDTSGITGANFFTAAVYQSNGADTSGYSSEASMANTFFTGWAQYADTQYTDIAPFSILADTDTVLPNNAGNVIESQLPADVSTFYSAGKITGRNGDGLGITIDFTATPTAGSATFIEVWIDIGGAVGQLYRRIISFPKGTGVERPVNFTVIGYTLGTWEANGGTVYVRSNGPVDIYGQRYVLTRTHKGVA